MRGGGQTESERHLGKNLVESLSTKNRTSTRILESFLERNALGFCRRSTLTLKSDEARELPLGELAPNLGKSLVELLSTRNTKHTKNTKVFLTKNVFWGLTRNRIVSAGEGFTLAEVLITLGIIGIVAAMTMPTIINKCQEAILKNQFKKAYATVYNAYYKTLSDLDFNNTCFYSTGTTSNPNDCKIFRENFIKNLKISKICDRGEAEGCIPKYKGIEEVKQSIKPDATDEELDFAKNNCYFSKTQIPNYNAIVLADGVTIIPSKNHGADQLMYAAMDINGKKGPNKWGYDIFVYQASFYNMKKLDFTGDGCNNNFIEKGGKNIKQMLQQ